MEVGDGGPPLFQQSQVSVTELLLEMLVEFGTGDSFALLPGQPVEVLRPGFQRWEFQRHPATSRLTEDDTAEFHGRLIHDGDRSVSFEWFISSGLTWGARLPGDRAA